MKRSPMVASFALVAVICVTGIPSVALAGSTGNGGKTGRQADQTASTDCGLTDIESPQPPAGFDPSAASAAQLSSYGFPVRPAGNSNDPAVEGWQTAVDDATQYVSTAPVCPDGGGSFGDKYSGNWAGHIVPATAEGIVGYNYIESSWTVPKVADNSSYTDCRESGTNLPPDAAVWDGLGAGYLEQAGTVSCSDSTARYRFWNEDFTQDPRYEGPSVAHGDTAFTEIDYNGGTSCTYFEEDETTGSYASYTHTDCDDIDLSQADFILERAGSHYLPSYDNVPQDINAFGSSTTSYNLVSGVGSKEIMTSNCSNTGTVLATATDIDASGNFTQEHEADNPVCN